LGKKYGSEKKKRKEEEKKKKKRRKKEKKKKNGEKLNKQDYFISLFTCVGVTNLIMSVGKYNKITSFFSPLSLMSDCLYVFPIYLREEWSLKLTSP
jgi:Na+/glutamate symporter